MRKDIERNPSIKVFVVDAIVISVVLLINLYIRSITVIRVNIVGDIKEIQMIKKYHESFGVLTTVSILVVLCCLVVSIYILQNERKKVTHRLNVLVNLFEKINLDTIPNNNPVLTEFDMQVIHAWNKSVEEINNQKQIRDDYFSSIVHDIKTPIQIVKSNLQMQKVEYGESEYLNSIREELTDLERTVLNYLVIEKINHFEKVTNRDEDITSYFEAVSSRYDKLGFNIVLGLKNTDRIYNLDITMFGKIVENLVSNAMRHGSSGEMYINVYDHKIEFINEFDYDHEIEDIFRSKERHHSSDGNGLGVQIIKTYVGLMKYNISSKCEDGKLIVTLNLS